MIMMGITFGDHKAHGISELGSARGSDSSVPMARSMTKFIEEKSHDVTIEGEPDTRYIH